MKRDAFDPVEQALKAEVSQEIRDTIARHKAHGERMTEAEISELQRVIRDGIEALSTKYRQSASTAELAVLLSSLDIEFEVMEGKLWVSCDTPEDLMNLGVHLAQHCPRVLDDLLARAKWNQARTHVYWEGV
jgi:predicted XRE-type DNA-binding protein